MDKKIVKFDLNPKSIKIKEILETKDFIAIEVWAISNAYPNNNNSHFPEETMIANVNDGNFYDKPVLGKWNSTNQDYEVHNSVIKYDNEFDSVYFDYENGECPMGTIRQSDTVEIRKDENGLTWVVFTAVLWTKYNYQAVKKLLKNKRKKVSVEVSVFQSHYDENDIEIFDAWSFDGVTILGNLPNSKIPAEAGIQNAHLTVLEKLEEALFSKQMKVVQFECANYNNVINSDNSDLYKYNEQKEGFKLFTYEQKREMLESVLREKLFNDENDCCYIWVADISDSFVWFHFDGSYYVANYSISNSESEGENEEPKTVVEVDTENMKKQLRAWTDFMEDDDSKKFDDPEDDPDKDDNKDEGKDDDKDDDENMCKGQMSNDDDMCKFTTVIDGVTFTGEELLQKYLDETSSYQIEQQKSFEEIESLKKSLSALEEGKSKIENDFSTLTAEKEQVDQAFADLSAEFSVLSTDNESFKMENDNLKKEIESLNEQMSQAKYQQIADKALKFAQSKALDVEICNEFVEKCKAGEYESFELVEKDIVYAAFIKEEKKQAEHEEFVSKISKPEATKADVKNDAFTGCRKIINK